MKQVKELRQRSLDRPRAVLDALERVDVRIRPASVRGVHLSVSRHPAAKLYLVSTNSAHRTLLRLYTCVGLGLSRDPSVCSNRPNPAHSVMGSGSEEQWEETRGRADFWVGH